MPDDTLEAGLREYERQMREALTRGLAKAALRLARDATTEEPTVPLDEGTLRGAWSVFVDNKLVQAGGAEAARDLSDPVAPDEICATVGYNLPYAAYQHEGHRADGSYQVRNYSEPGSGPKFLERKLSENREQYMEIVAREAKKVARGSRVGND